MRNVALLLFSALWVTACANELAPLDLSAGGGLEGQGVAAPVDGNSQAGEVLAIDVSHWSGPISDQDVDCWWDAGYRHLIAGTQREHITRQQLAMATERGMTVDVYHYVYWDTDITQQVEYAIETARGFPIGRLWIDLEENTGGLSQSEVERIVDDALVACGDVECGIYTGAGFWRGFMFDTDRYKDFPLWHAWWDNVPSLSTWDTQAFGGWDFPEAKQFEGDITFCGLITDQNIMYVPQSPTVFVEDRDPAGDPSVIPDTPTGLWPGDDVIVYPGQIRPMSRTVPGADRYELHVESWNGSSWSNYFTWTRDESSVRIGLAFENRAYRFRVRAHNAAGWSSWSTWSRFGYVTDATDHLGVEFADPSGPATNPPDSSSPAEPDPIAEPEPADPSGPSTNPPDSSNDGGEPTNAPANLSPADEDITSSSVTLRCDEYEGASAYAFEIEYEISGGFTSYFTYTSTQPLKTFWPASRNGIEYRFRVRADDSDWSAWSHFTVN
jgi:hypothetical protein